MNVEAHFQAIPQIIVQYLTNATQSIQVAVAWFTDKSLFDVLCKKAEAGLVVELMLANDPINQQNGPDYKLLTKAGGHVYIVGSVSSGPLMHNKFAIIDFKHIITGSYNWSYRAKQNHENITVTTDAQDLALQYYQEFCRLREKYIDPNQQRLGFDTTQLLTRLDVILGLLRLGEKSQAQLQIQLIRSGPTPLVIDEILIRLEKGENAEAARLISEFRTAFQRLVLYDDEEVYFLKLELKGLEQEVVALENEKSEIERTINDFIRKYHDEFGHSLFKKSRLQLQYDKLRNRALPNQEETEYDRFRNEQKQIFERVELTPTDSELLKKIYRKAVMLCHPDKMPKEHEADAQVMFVKLTDAYQQNDLATVTSLLGQIEQGVWLSRHSRSDILTERTKLRQVITQLRSRIAELKTSIDQLIAASNYNDLPSPDNWDEFIAHERVEIQMEIDKLNSKINYYESQRLQH